MVASVPIWQVPIWEWVAVALVLGGAAFSVVAAIGILRFEDVFMRMHASTKAGTLGVGLIMAATLFAFTGTSAVARAVGTIVFVLLTAPVAAHVIARAAYYAGAKLDARTVVDERQAAKAEAEADRLAAE